MRDIEILPFRPQDGQQVTLAPWMREHQRSQLFKRTLWSNFDEGPAYTGWYRDRIIACGGVRLFWPGVGEAWGIFCEQAYDFRRELLFYTKLYLDRITIDHDLRRLHATADVEWEVAWGFLEHLGFKLEAVMRKYGPNGHDYYLYAKIKE